MNRVIPQRRQEQQQSRETDRGDDESEDVRVVVVVVEFYGANAHTVAGEVASQLCEAL